MRSRDERGQAASALASVALALAVLAVLAVLASATTAGVSYRAEEAAATDPTPGAPDPTADPTADPTEDEPEERLFPDGQLLTGDRRDNAQVEIPSVEEGWEYQGGRFLGYQVDVDKTLVGVNDPFVLDEGFCTDAEGGPEDRGFVGFAAPVSETTADDRARDAAEQTVERWLPGIFADESDYPDAEYAEIELADGSPALTATLEFPITEDRDRCSPPAVELTFLAVETGEYVAVVALNRPVEIGGGDLRGGLGREEADRILTSATIPPGS